ncbi:MAG: pyruvate formate lyase family protein, partial [Bacteroides sp.]
MNAYEGFKSGKWVDEINVNDFILSNYTEYTGDESFLVGPTDATKTLWNILLEKFKVEKEKGVYDAETRIPSQIDSYPAGYIDKDLEKIVGVQTDAPLKRAIFPNGGLRMVKQSLKEYGYDLDPQTEEVFTKYRKTHNDGVFAAYTSSIRKARSNAIITGLPDAYGRGRIIGDYRRVALYGVDRLIQERKDYFAQHDPA